MTTLVRLMRVAPTALLALTAVACAPGAAGELIRPDDPTAAGAFGESETQCHESGESAQPLIVDWRAHERANLEEAMSGRVAVVKYDCNGLRLLRDCYVPGSYGFLAMSRKKEAVKLNDADEIRTNLPLGGLKMIANFKAEIERGMTVDLATVMIGKRTTTVRSAALEEAKGQCDGATHYVRGAFIGAFAMKSGTRGKVVSEAELFGSGVAGESSSSKSIDNADGEPRRCDHVEADVEKSPAGCSAMLRLELVGLLDKPSSSPPEQRPSVRSCPGDTVLADGKCTRRNKTENPYQCGDTAQECTTQCDRGQAESCNRLGTMYAAGGGGLSKDVVKATQLYQRACEAGAASGCHNLALAYETGAGGVARDAAKAVGLFRRACDAGLPDSCSSLGVRHHNGGGGLARDVTKAVPLFRRACDGGNADGCSNLGSMYVSGRGGVAQDTAIAARLYQRACEGGSPPGCANLARMYKAGGFGVAKDDAKAVELLQRGCRFGGDISCADLGLMYDEGRGRLAKDEAKAITFYQRSCRGRFIRGCHYLGYSYANGKGGLIKNEAKAVEFYRRSCDGGVPNGCRHLGLSYEHGRGLTKDEAKAVEFYRTACELGGAHGCLLLGRMHRAGRGGLAVDPAKARELNDRACRMGVPSACNN